jgi:glucokinase
VSIVVGIDAGGTKLAAALVDTVAGTVLARRRALTRPARGAAAVLADCVALTHAVASAGPPVAVGLAVPELVDRSGAITSHSNWDWRGWDLREAFAEIGPLRVESDVRAAALAEARFGAGHGRASFLYFTIGTGVSHTFAIDGVPWLGANGNAIVVGAPLIERVASGPQLARLTGSTTAEDALATEAGAHALDEVARILASELARLINSLDPEAVVIGGGLGLVPAFHAALVTHARPLIYADATRELPIGRAALGSDAGPIGAALAASPERGGHPDHRSTSGVERKEPRSDQSSVGSEGR